MDESCLDEYTLGEPRYTHTTFGIWEPTIWAHERDARDAREGREDVEPLDSPLTQAIGQLIAEENVWLTATHHIDIPAVKAMEGIDTAVIVGSGEEIKEAASHETEGEH